MTTLDGLRQRSGMTVTVEELLSVLPVARQAFGERWLEWAIEEQLLAVLELIEMYRSDQPPF